MPETLRNFLTNVVPFTPADDPAYTSMQGFAYEFDEIKEIFDEHQGADEMPMADVVLALRATRFALDNQYRINLMLIDRVRTLEEKSRRRRFWRK